MVSTGHPEHVYADLARRVSAMTVGLERLCDRNNPELRVTVLLTIPVAGLPGTTATVWTGLQVGVELLQPDGFVTAFFRDLAFAGAHNADRPAASRLQRHGPGRPDTLVGDREWRASLG